MKDIFETEISLISYKHRVTEKRHPKCRKPALNILGLCLVFIGSLNLSGQDLALGDTLLPTNASDLARIVNQESGSYALSVEDFLRSDEKSNFRLLRDGNRLSYILQDSLFVVLNISAETEQKFPIQNLVPESEYIWINDSRVLFVSDNDGKEVYHLYSLDIETGSVQDLTPYDGVTVLLLNQLPAQRNQVVIAMNKDNLEVFEPYLIDVSTGELTKLFENKLSNGFITDYYFSDSGELRAYYAQDDTQDYVLYNKTKNGEFAEVLRLAFGEFFLILHFDEQNPNLVYASSNLNTDKRNIVQYDLEKGKVVKMLFSNATYDINDFGSLFEENTIDYYSYVGIGKTIVPVSEEYSTIHSKLSEQLAGQSFEIKEASATMDKLLVHTESDKIAGRYYLYYVQQDSLGLLLDTKPQLDPQLLTDKTHFTFYSRDSLHIEGYYYKPLQAHESNKVPLLIIPHGGPYDIRNEWSFVNYAQLFANRGYCVLEVNFRGSFGYGKQFQTAGFNQIGRAMLDDLQDAIAHMTQHDWIDSERIGIYGPSYGGLATLQSLVEYPDVFKCGIDYCGPSNLFTLFEAFPPSWKEYIAFFHRAWYNPSIEEQRIIMEEVSPFFHLDSIKSPLLVVHGANDPRVPISESDQIVSKLRQNGLDVPYLVKYDEGHGFMKEENNIYLNKVVLGFLAKNLKGSSNKVRD